MGSTSTLRNCHGLRAGNSYRDTPLKRRQETPGTSDTRPRHRDTPPSSNRHRNHGYRLALFILFGLLGTMTVASPAQAKPLKDCPQHHAILRKYGLPPKIFGPIAWRESRCSFKSISAVRHTGYPDVSLLQIQGSWRTLTRKVCKLKKNQSHIKALTRPDCHLRVAAVLWDNGKGAGHWNIRSGSNG